MPAYRGVLTRVGSKEGDMIVNSSGNSAVGNVRVSGKVSVIEIGKVTLRDVGCTNDIYDLMDPGRDVTLYVHRHFFNKPIVIGIKHMDSGRVYMMRFGTLIASALSYVLIYPLLILAGAFLIGMMGGKDGGIMSTLAVLFIVGGFGLCAWTAGMLVKNYFVWRGGPDGLAG
jgi:hypothetical protein